MFDSSENDYGEEDNEETPFEVYKRMTFEYIDDKNEQKLRNHLKQIKGTTDKKVDDQRTIQRIDIFDVSPDPTNAKWKQLDDGYLTIKDKIGAGSFCKVKEAVV